MSDYFCSLSFNFHHQPTLMIHLSMHLVEELKIAEEWGCTF